MPPDWQALLEDFWTLRDATAPGFADIGRLSIQDITAMYEMRFWSDIGYPFADYFDTMVMLDKTLRKYHQSKNAPPPKI